VCVLERDRGRVTRIRVQDQCAEEEYRERDSPCEVRLHLLSYRCYVTEHGYRFCYLRSGTLNVAY